MRSSQPTSCYPQKGGIAAWPAQKALLFTNDASFDPKTHAPPRGDAGRVNITLRLSTDDGRTWPGKKLISHPGGYTDVVLHTAEGKDWAAVVFAEEPIEGDCMIKLAIVDPHELLPPPAR